MVKPNTAVCTISPQKVKKILVIRFSSLGDIILLNPIFKTIKALWPDREMIFVTKYTYRKIAINNPYVDKCVFLNEEGKTLSKMIYELANMGRFEYIFDMHNNIRSFLIKLFIRGNYRHTINKFTVKRYLTIWTKRDYKIPDAVERYKNVILSAARTSHISAQLNYEFFIPNINYYKNLSYSILPQEYDNRYICISPGAKWLTKRWPVEKYAELLKFLINDAEESIVLTGDKDEIAIGERLLSLVNNKDKNVRVINLIGRTALDELVGIVSRAKLYIGNDSGTSHIAAMANVPSVIILGPTDKKLGFFPYKNNNVYIIEKSLNCRPCTLHGRNRCPKKHFKCMYDITAEEVYMAARRLL